LVEVLIVVVMAKPIPLAAAKAWRHASKTPIQSFKDNG
jgi:hypothetical protein